MACDNPAIGDNGTAKRDRGVCVSIDASSVVGFNENRSRLLHVPSLFGSTLTAVDNAIRIPYC